MMTDSATKTQSYAEAQMALDGGQNGAMSALGH